MTGKSPDLRKLEIDYDEENDTLWIGNGRPTPRGFDIVENSIIVFFEEDGVTPSGVMLFDTLELLGPHLSGKLQSTLAQGN
jgi:hypothetical protein